MYLNAHTQNAENTINYFENIKFENNLVKTESNQGERASAYGGALLIKGGTTTLKNTILQAIKLKRRQHSQIVLRAHNMVEEVLQAVQFLLTQH